MVRDPEEIGRGLEETSAGSRAGSNEREPRGGEGKGERRIPLPLQIRCEYSKSAKRDLVCADYL